MPLVRLDKLLCDTANVSRGEAKSLIRAGRVLVDGEAVKQPETKVDEQARTER